jgi:hypothetical protein
MTPLRLFRRSIVRPAVAAAALIYFLIDALFLSLVRPIGRWLMALPAVRRLQAWIDGTNRYTALALFLVPVALLEPVKPLGLYLIARDRRVLGLCILVAGELVKVTLLDRVFQMTKPKLMTFRWFAWCYVQWTAIMERIRSHPVWRQIRSRLQMLRRWAAQW